MKKACIVTVIGVLALAVAGSTLAQTEKDMAQKRPKGFQKGGERFEKGPAGMDRQEALIICIINHPEIAEEIGLTEEQIKTLRDSMYEMKKQEIRLEAEKKLAAMEQARLLTESTIAEEAVMAAVEKTSKIAAELARLKVKQLLLVKKTLTPEDIKKIEKLMREHMRDRMQERRKGGRVPGSELRGEKGLRDREESPEEREQEE